MSDIFSYDNDTSIHPNDIDPIIAHLHHSDLDNSDDEFEEVEAGEFEEVEADEYTAQSPHRSFAADGRYLLVDSPIEIGIRINERRRLYGNLEEQETSQRLLPAAGFSVKNLKHVIADDKMVCVICKDNVCVGSVVIRLPCGHMYHPPCIKPWLNARNTCPLCRYELPTDDEAAGVNVATSSQGNNVSGGGKSWWFVVGIGLLGCLGGGIIWWSKGQEKQEMVVSFVD